MRSWRTGTHWRRARGTKRRRGGLRGEYRRGAGPRFPMRRQVYLRYRDMKVLEEEDPTLYKIKLEQIQVEDELFGAAAVAREGTRDGGRPSEEQRRRLHEVA